SRKIPINKKQLTTIMMVTFLVGIIVIIIVGVIFLYNRDQETFEYNGWIDCMPELSKSQAELCRRAEAAGYPYIAY
ncbi:MAG: hypothetical protein II670_07725, partial [Alphaproteobacteria bacterium]|nr:hypothetical protein [Alphaproteobacteria bacterium]